MPTPGLDNFKKQKIIELLIRKDYLTKGSVRASTTHCHEIIWGTFQTNHFKMGCAAKRNWTSKFILDKDHFSSAFMFSTVHSM